MNLKDTSGRRLFYVLCGIVFLTPLITGHDVFINAWRIFWMEALFVSGYLIYQGRLGFPKKLFPVKSVGFWLLAIWFCSTTLSLLLSPYGLMVEWFAVQRYFQTLFHLVFFLCVLRFFDSYKGALDPLFFSWAASVAVLAIVFVWSWHALDSTLDLPEYFWYWDPHPPLNFHIRITDMLATAASALVVPYFFCDRKTPGRRWVVSFVLALPAWSLLFWCGGRGGILSATAAGIAILGYFLFRKLPVKWLILGFGLSVLGGLLLANAFSVLPWNGLGGAVERSVQGGLDMRGLSNSRFDFWWSVWESINLNQAYAFGLGAQGYCYMPNRIMGYQAHNAFLQFFCEWGVVGLVVFTVLLLYGFSIGVKKHLLHQPKSVCLGVLAALGVLLALGAHSMVDDLFYHAQPSLYLAIVFAVWMTTHEE